MNLLHGVTLEYPDAISFCSGRPPDEECAVEEFSSWVNSFKLSQKDPSTFHILLGQYGPTNGIIRHSIAQMLEKDESLHVDYQDIVMTVGAQEAIMLLLLSLFNRDTDVLIITDPCFIGMTGAALLLGIEIEPVSLEGTDRERLKKFEDIICKVKRKGKNPKGIYLTPDFDNPSGISMSLDLRKNLILLAKKNQVLLFEDTTYRVFRYKGKKLPMLKALDDCSSTVSIGSFAKTLYPGLRLGYIIANKSVETTHGTQNLTTLLSRTKSMLTVNVSPIIQAAVAGMLLEHSFSLEKYSQKKVMICKSRRDCMLKSLSRVFLSNEFRNKISWNYPEGGFFITINLPFDFTHHHLELMAKNYGVIVLPMDHLAMLPDRKKQIRLAFSNVSEKYIKEGISRLGSFISYELQTKAR